MKHPEAYGTYDRDNRRRQRKSETFAERHHRHTMNLRTAALAAPAIALAAALIALAITAIVRI